jgi:hypothetical protein
MIGRLQEDLVDRGKRSQVFSPFSLDQRVKKKIQRKMIHQILTIKKNPLLLRRLMNGNQILLFLPIYDLSISSQKILILSWSRGHHWKAVAWI